MIELPYGGNFEEVELADYIRQSGRNYIIQGQVACAMDDHPKIESLDYWLRQFAANPDTKQAENAVIEDLINTGLFTESLNLICPETGETCKGLVLAA